jgi:hypothetical protein
MKLVFWLASLSNATARQHGPLLIVMVKSLLKCSPNRFFGFGFSGEGQCAPSNGVAMKRGLLPSAKSLSDNPAATSIPAGRSLAHKEYFC